MAIAAIVSILLIEDIQDDLPDYLKWGASLKDIVQYYLVLIPSFMPIVLPVALLLSVLLGVGNLHRRNEILAMRANGLSLFQVSRWVLIAGMVVAAINYFLHISWVPLSMERSRELRHEWQFETENKEKSENEIGLIPHLTYYNHRDGRIWVMNRFSQYTLQGYGVSFYRLNEKGKEVERILAKEAVYDDPPGHWTFLDGVRYEMDPQTGSARRRVMFEELPRQKLQVAPELMLLHNRDPEDLSANELRALLEHSPPQKNPHTREHATRLRAMQSSPAVCVLAVLIAIPFAVSGVRANPVVNVAKAIVFFFFYYGLVLLTQVLGSQGVLTPIYAAWLPHGLAVPFALWLWWRER